MLRAPVILLVLKNSTSKELEKILAYRLESLAFKYKALACFKEYKIFDDDRIAVT